MKETDLKTNLAAVRFEIELRHQKKLAALAELEKLLMPQDLVEVNPVMMLPPKEAELVPPALSVKPKTGKPGRLKPHVLEAARHLDQPFTSRDLADAVGFTPKDAGNFIHRWLGKGWMEQVRAREWKRTATFGKELPSDTPSDTPTGRGQVMLENIHAEIAAKKQTTED